MDRFEMLVQLYSDNQTPTVIVDENYSVIWNNPAAQGSFLSTHISVKEAIRQTTDAEERLKNGKTTILYGAELYADTQCFIATPMDEYTIVQSSNGLFNSGDTRYFTGEMRNNLSELLAVMPALLEKTEQSADAIRFNEIMLGCCYNQLRSVTNLSTLSSLLSEPELPRQDINITQFMQSIVSGTESLCKGCGIPISYFSNSADDDLYISCDERLLSAAVLNIINNSLSFTKDYNEITITVNKVGKNVLLIFSDSGMGIDEHVISQIFDPYFSCDKFDIKNPRPGVGLGLAVVKYLMLRYKGSYSVKSRRFEGTDIMLSFPMVEPDMNRSVVECDLSQYLVNRYSPLYVQLSKFIKLGF